MVEKKLPSGENTSPPQLANIIRGIGSSSTSDQVKFDKIALEWAKKTTNFVNEVALSIIYMLNETSKHNVEPRKKDNNVNFDFSAVLQARWNELSDIKNDQHLLIQNKSDKIETGWNSSVFIEGIQKLVEQYCQNIDNTGIFWDKVIKYIINNSKQLFLSGNDGSFEFFCSILGEIYRRSENMTYVPNEDEFYCKIDPFLQKWENPIVQAHFIIKICRLGFEVQNGGYNINRRNDLNFLDESLLNDDLKFDQLYPNINNYSIIIDATNFIPESLISMLRTDTRIAELIENGILGTPIIYNESKLPRLAIIHSKGSCGAFLCTKLLKVVFDLCGRVKDQKLLDQLHTLLYFDIPRYSPIGTLSSLGVIYSDLPNHLKLSGDLVNKVSELLETNIKNNEIDKTLLISISISSTQEFICSTRSKIITTSQEKEYELGPNFGLLMQILFTSFDEYGSRRSRNLQYIRDFFSQIALRYRFSSIVILSRLTSLGRKYIWKFLKNEYQVLPRLCDMVDSKGQVPPIFPRENRRGSKSNLNIHIDYFHWWFLCLDLIVAGISIRQNPGLNLSESECNEIIKDSTEALSRLFQMELRDKNPDSFLLVVAIVDYVRARLVYMTYASAELQTILVNRRISLPSFSFEKAVNFKIFAARIVRRNLLLGSPKLSFPSNFWVSSFGTPSFSYYYWCISSFVILAVKNAIIEFRLSVDGLENIQVFNLLEALTEFEMVKASGIGSGNIDSFKGRPPIHSSNEIFNTSVREDGSQVDKCVSDKALVGVRDRNNRSNSITPIHDEESEEQHNIEISNKVNEYFTDLYTGKTSVSELINELKENNLKDTTGECKLFNLFLQTLFDECRSFPKYPIPELKMTAIMLGTLVKEDMLIPYGNALVFVQRCIIEALRKHHWSKMFCFGVLAMEQFIDKLINFPQFLFAILMLSKHLEPAIGMYIRYSEYCLSLLPDGLKSRLYVEKVVLENLGISPPLAPKNLVSSNSPEMISFVCPKENTEKECCSDSENRLGSLVKLDISSKKALPDGLTVEQLQGFGLGSLEKLMNDPRIYNTIAIPSDNIIEDIFTICNTLASTNIDSKANEMAVILNQNPEYSYWFAFYLVKNRASKEKNNHPTYVKFLLKLDELLDIVSPNLQSQEPNDSSIVPITRKGNDSEVRRGITDITALASYDCIKAILSYSTILNEISSFVNILRHLGYWLGQITIGINRPIVHKYLNPRQLLIESYYKGCIASTLPFVCKILENIKNTQFHPPNPWTNSLLFTLAEIHSTSSNANSRMFEVELLFKQLELNLEDYVNKTNYLMLDHLIYDPHNANAMDEEQRRIYMNTRAPQGINSQYSGMSYIRNTTQLNGFPRNFPHNIQPNTINDSQLASLFMPPQYGQVLTHQTRQYQTPGMDMQFLASKVLISPSIALFQIQPSLRPLVPLALDRSIKEILQVVIPRSVRIAIITTREIVGKDFAFEPDENIYRRATQLMVSSLSGSMAIAACREPLRVAFTAQLRQMLYQILLREEDHVLVEQIAQVLCSDNIDLGCYVIEQAVIKRAVEELEDVISPGVIYRRRMRESGQQFIDMNYYGGPNSQIQTLYLSSLPEMLRYKQNSMRHLQLYRDFLLFTLMRNVNKRDPLPHNETRTINTLQQASQVPIQPLRSDQTVDQTYKPYFGCQNAIRPQNRQDLAQNAATPGRIDTMDGRQSYNNVTYLNTTTTPTYVVQPPEPVRVPLLFELSLFPLLSRVDECISQIKDVIREMALYPPIFARSFFPPVGDLQFESHYMSQSFTFSKPLGSKVAVSPQRTASHPVLSVLASLSSDHILFYLCKVICTIGVSASQKEDVLIGILQKLFRTLFDAAAAYQQSIIGAIPSTKCIASALGFDAALLHIEVFLGLSHQIMIVNSKFCSRLKREAVGWLVHIIEEPKYSVDIFVGALRYDLIPAHELDVSLTSILDRELPLDEHCSPIDLEKFINFIEFTYKLFFRCIGDWHFPINEKLPKTTQVLSQVADDVLIQNHLYTRIVILPGFYYKPYPPKISLAEIKIRVDDLLKEINSNKSSNNINAEWIGEEVPEVLNFCTIIKSNTNRILNPTYPKLPVPMAPSSEIVNVVGRIFDEWVLLLRITIFSGAGVNERNNPYRNLFLQRLTRQGLLKMDDRTEKLFTVCIERAIHLSLNDMSADLPLHKNTINTKCNDKSDSHIKIDPFPLDSLVKLITSMTHFLDPQQMLSVVTTHKFLSIFTKIIHKDSESPSFNQRPYYRIFFALLCEYESIGRSSEMVHFTCLLSIVHHLHYVNPNRVPAFTYSWIQIIASNKLFPHLLRHAKGWQPYQSLLIQLFNFISPYLKCIQLSNNIKSIYGALLRMLLVLLHDFPEFLCDYSYSFCDALPLNCIQIRNLILSAFPRSMKLPDPFLPTLKIENIPEIKIVPRMISNYGPFILYKGLKSNVDKYWVTRDSSVLPLIIKTMRLNKENALKRGTKYFFPVITALLLYVGIYLPNGSNSNNNIDNSSEHLPIHIPDLENSKINFDNTEGTEIDVDCLIDSIEDPSLAIFLFLSRNLDMEGRFNFISAITNFLGYPNYYTLYFRTLLLWLFLNSGDSVVQEQITRILLERLIVHRPHPWGLLITFIELIKNPRYSFWNCSFVRLAPEVEKLFQSVAQTCLGQGANKNNSVNS